MEAADSSKTLYLPTRLNAIASQMTEILKLSSVQYTRSSHSLKALIHFHATNYILVHANSMKTKTNEQQWI
jgi:hypothetical protein